MISVCTFLWHDPQAKCRHIYTYTPDHVRTLRRMVDRHLSLPHEFVCITDKPDLFSPNDGIRTVPLDMETHVPGTRYAKLMIYRPDAGATIGRRILCLDLDTVIVGCIDPIVDRAEDLVLWRNPNFGIPGRARYNTSIVLLAAGTRPEFWTKFRKHSTPAILARYVGGTDQAWVSHLASPNEAHWTDRDGVYGAGRLGDAVQGVGTVLPANARIVFTPGKREPSLSSFRESHPWSVEHYR
jgi:hypothetical protein